MVRPHINQIVFSIKDFDDSKEELFKAVSKQLELLLTAGYIAVVRYDEPGVGIVSIEYEHNEYLEYWGGYSPIWITQEEEDQIITMRETPSYERT